LVELPPGDHRLRLHLLFGATSQWADYVVSLDNDKPARFEVQVPRIDGERAQLPIRVNFYLNGRWCGEGERNIEVRARAEAAPGQIMAVQATSLRREFSFDPGLQPPDLIVRIQRRRDIGRYHWSCVSPHGLPPPPAAPEDSEMLLGTDAESYVRNLFKPLAGKSLEKIDVSQIEGIGEAIYKATPKAFKEAYWALQRTAQAGGFAFASVLIVTDEPFIPWELMRIVHDGAEPKLKAEFLGIRHAVGRWLAPESLRLLQRLRVSQAAVAASGYDGIDSVPKKLPWAEKEKELLRDRYSAKVVELKSADFVGFLEKGGAQALHVACHGVMSVVSPQTSQLIMEDNPANVMPAMVDREEVRDAGLGKDRPLVFLNACEVGGAAASLSLVAGFPAAFLGGGAAAVISPLWAVHDERAKRIAERFYESALAPSAPTLGEIVKQIRAMWREEKHLTFLAYVLYGDPLMRIDYKR
jgi:hypothetical protein